MRTKIIIGVSIFGFLIAAILSSVIDVQNKERLDGGAQQLEGRLEEDAAAHLFKYLPVDW
ncbi:MAG TPA: hypothetical protein PKA19_08340 [Bacillota bacterium]|nr:hypothetical protein [Bacillota bacterium]